MGAPQGLTLGGRALCRLSDPDRARSREDGPDFHRSHGLGLHLSGDEQPWASGADWSQISEALDG